MMKRGLAFSVMCAALAVTVPGAAQAAEGCAPITDAEQLWQRPALRWVIVGELHGTQELPAAFGDMVCAAAKASGKPVTVGLEFPQQEQVRFDAYMASSGDAAARAALLQGDTWRQGMRDGRSSEAMVALIERLRVMKAAGQVTRLLAIRKQAPPAPGQAFDPAAAEALIGEGMREAGTSDGLTLIFIGNIHAAMRKFASLRYAPAASFLPADQTVTLNLSYGGGSAWTCQMPSANAKVECLARPMPGPSQAGPRAIVLDETAALPWSGTFASGSTITASPPAVPVTDSTQPSS